MKSVPFLNSVPLRRLLRKHGSMGYLIVGLVLAGHWLCHYKRRQSLAVLTLLAAAGAFTLYPVTCHLARGGSHPSIRAAYSVTDLGVASGYEYSFAEKINNKGQVAGDIADEEFEKLHGFSTPAAK